MESEDRIAFIAFSYGTICSNSTVASCDMDFVIQQINNRLVDINQPLMTKQEEEIPPQLDRFMELFKLSKINRKDFRKKYSKDASYLRKRLWELKN